METTTRNLDTTAETVLQVLRAAGYSMEPCTVARYAGVTPDEARRALADLVAAGETRRLGDGLCIGDGRFEATGETACCIALPPRPVPIKDRPEEAVRILGEHGPLTITDAAALFDTTLEDAHHLLTLAWARHDADFDVDSGRWQATGRPWW